MKLFNCHWEPSREDPLAPPRLLLSVDVEEEFDWSGPFARTGHTTRSPGRLHRLEAVARDGGILPLYLVSYPVLQAPHAAAILRSSWAAGRCVIGSHLHPWVTPPYDDALTDANSFPGNLPAELEAAKLTTLTEGIRDALGVQATAYRAGRYGLGANTARALQRLGYSLDLSAIAHMDLRQKSGPDFSRVRPRPYTVATELGRIRALPVSRGYLGLLQAVASRSGAPWSGSLDRFHIGGALRRLRLLDRCTLTPEHLDLEAQIALTRQLHAAGVRTFCMNLHSTSLIPGATPYAVTELGVNALLDRLKRYLDFFVGELRGLCAAEPPCGTPAASGETPPGRTSTSAPPALAGN